MLMKNVQGRDGDRAENTSADGTRRPQGRKRMRTMNDEEMRQAVGLCRWATICSVDSDCAPYAIEATPFHDGSDICFMINPRGGTWRNVQQNPRVLLKFTLASPGLLWWAGVSCHGQGAFDADPAAIRRGWDLLGAVMKQDYSRFADRFCAHPERSPLFRVKVLSLTGRCSAAVGELLNFKALKDESDLTPLSELVKAG